MPTRRNTLLGLGILGAGGAGAVATGAFSAATAERDVSASFVGDDSAVLGFDPTSRYADLEEGDDGFDILTINFNDLNARSNFTFLDTFRVINNGNNPARLVDVRSSTAEEANDGLWNNEDSENEHPGRVLIGDTPDQWQGQPHSDEIDSELDDEQYRDGGYSEASDAFAGGSGPELSEQGGWIPIGFRFQGADGVIGGWDPDEDIPEEIQLVFESDEIGE